MNKKAKQVETKKDAKIGTAIMDTIKSTALHFVAALMIASTVLFRLETGTDI